MQLDASQDGEKISRVVALLSDKHYDAPSVFQPAALLAHARRQRDLPDDNVPGLCLLDPDGDIANYLRRSGRSTPLPSWACYHTELDVFDLDGRKAGIVGRAVGAPFAVLVAEELAASGCGLLVSVTSAGRIGTSVRGGFVLIDRAVRDEGTSYHYLPADREATLNREVADALLGAFDGFTPPVVSAASWTTDAPFRETQQAIDRHAADGVACVEMEAAALYAYAQASGARIVCLAHLTNDMGRSAIDFEKGTAEGAEQALALAARVAARLDPR